MALSILNNIPALQAENQLTATNNALQTTLYRLASGSKLNSGADDAAGLSIANGLSANVAALTQSAANASNGVGELQVADGALSQVTSLLNRAVTLATEASTGTVNSTQAQSLDTEYQSIKAEIDRIGQKTTFNNQNVFGSGSSGAASTGVWNFATAVADPTATFGTGGEAITITDTKSDQTVTFNTSKTTDDATHATTLDNLVSDINNYKDPTSGQALNVTASIVGGKLVLTDTSGSNSVFVTAATTTDLGAVTESTGTKAVNQNVWTSGNGSSSVPLQASTAFATNGDVLTIYDSDTQKSATYTVGAVAAYAQGASTVGTIGDLVADINKDTANGQLGVTASIDATTGKLTLTDTNGDNSFYVTQSGMAELGSVSDQTSGTVTTNNVYLGDGTATTASNTISTSISSLSAVTDLGLTQDLTTTANAQAALSQITSAIANVAQQRGVIGASINRLNAATNVINTQIENLSSAQNNISAADISTEVSNMTKYNVLTQTGISALSQANQMQQALLKLLQ